MSKLNDKNNITQIIAFGNSYSDNGEARKISSAILKDTNSPKEAFIKPTEGLYWNSRYSNGYTAVEILSKKLDVKLLNYATGGATSGQGNYSKWMDYLGGTGLLGQIDKFENSLHVNKIDTDALYFIYACENDYFAYMDFAQQGTIEELAYNTVENINVAIRKLAELGAKKFFIVNCSDLSLVPYEITMNRTNFANIFVNIVNKTLPKTIIANQSELDISIIMFDHTRVSRYIVKNSEKYGFIELSKEYQSTYPEVLTASGESDGYYFWDEWHVSRITHKIFGEAMYKKIIN